MVNVSPMIMAGCDEKEFDCHEGDGDPLGCSVAAVFSAIKEAQGAQTPADPASAVDS